MPDPTNETPDTTDREQILLAMAAKLKESPALQKVPVHITRPMTLRDRVTLAQVETVYGSEQLPAIDVQASA
jgi:hypothetical protein